MKAISDSAEEKVKSTIKSGLDITSKSQYFPPEISTYLLELKMSQNLPVSLLPDSPGQGKGQELLHKLPGQNTLWYRHG